MKDTKIQWHPGFVAAMNLEFAKNREQLIFEKEYNLNTKPLEIDLLVVKKEASVQIMNEIGSFFRGHNIMEYKSPEDHLDIDAFYKAGAYASLYKSYGKTTDAIKADDITVSMIREAKPEGLFQYFKEHGYQVLNPHKGIYYIENNVLFPTQVIVTKELNRAEHIWLGALSAKLEKKDMQELVENIRKLTEKEDKELADSVLQVSIEANRQIVDEMMGDDHMCEALMEIMEPIVEKREKAMYREGKILGAVEAMRELGQSDYEISTMIIRKYGLSEEEAEKYL
ncbi:MAG: hypothetical protein J6A92_06455 [Lachnospiraceae bacterium]|nr:hypothetical protein [Lachnospiraceae bacterium]